MIKRFHTSSLPMHFRAAFSLVEVTLCLGIVAFALLALLGLLPVGLMSTQATIAQTAHTHIVKKIAGEVNMMPLADLPDYILNPQYYDYDGKPTTQAHAVFTVTLQTSPAAYPGSSQISGISKYLQTIKISISQDGANPFITSIPAVNYYPQSS